MAKPIRATAIFLIALSAVGAGGLPAAAQKKPTTDKQIYDAIDCKQWTHNADGTWSGGATARVGSMTFPNTINNTMKGYVDSGVDAETALLKKCGKA